MEQKRGSYKTMMSQKSAARYLIVVKGYTQREVSNLLGISERSMSIWVKKYKWKKDIENEASKYGGLSEIMEGFIKYVKQRNPEISDEVKSLWVSYLKMLERK